MITILKKSVIYSALHLDYHADILRFGKNIILVLFFTYKNIISDKGDIYHIRCMNPEHIGT